MGLTIIDNNQIFVVERFVVNKVDDKFYMTINSKYVIPGIISSRFSNESEVIDRLVECLKTNEVFDIVREFNSDSSPLTPKEYTNINSSKDDLEIIENTEELFSNIPDTEPSKIVEESDSLGEVIIPSSDVFENTEEDIELVNSMVTDSNVRQVITPASQVISDKDREVIINGINYNFWGDLSSVEEASKEKVMTPLYKQQRLHEEGKLSKEEIDKVNTANKKYVSVINTDRAKNKIEYFDSITRGSSGEKGKPNTVDKLKLSFRGILKLLSLTEK